ncbi:MAG: heavy-metal-associated domain-containing protein [Bdellovibrionales bacterium]|nr:heavy-metal-associated domain-containing protein [Bdellovibrionales bacterium]
MGQFKVEDMTCGHCEKAIRTELSKGDPKIKVDVDLKKKLVTVENLTDDRVIFLLKEIGYSANPVQHQ